jgi:hypothetical protein
MRHLALAHFIEMTYNHLELMLHRSHSVSEALVAEMAALAKNHGVKFIVADICDGRTMQNFAKKNKIPSIDISVDLNIKENTNLPYSSHPNAVANKKYANSLKTFLRAEILE